MSDAAAVDPAKRFVCGIATGTAAGYPDDAYDLILRRIKDCVDVPGLVVTRWRYNSALEVYADVGITDAQQRLVEAVVWGFSLGFKTGTRTLAEQSCVATRPMNGTLGT